MGGGCSSSRAVQVHPATSVVPAATDTAPPTAHAAPVLSNAGATPGGQAASLAAVTEPRAHASAAPDSSPPPSSAAAQDVQTAAEEDVKSGPLHAPGPAPAPKAKQKPKSLIKAVKDGNLELVDELLRATDCNLETLGMWENTPLLAACTYGHAQVALRLIARNANVVAKNEHGATPLHYAAVEGSLDVVNALLEAGQTADSKCVLEMANPAPAKVYNRHLDAYGQRTPLASAAESGFTEVCERLLAAGARPDDQEEEGRSPLWLACRHSKVAVAKLLFMHHGADTSRKDHSGVSVLAAATAGGCNEELVLALLTHGVGDVNDTAGSPLRDAVKASKRSVAEALITHGASVHSTSVTDGATALHAACEKGDEHLVALLVRSRANPSLGDAKGLTAFDLLRRRGMTDGNIVALLSPPTGTDQDDGGTGGASGNIARDMYATDQDVSQKQVGA